MYMSFLYEGYSMVMYVQWSSTTPISERKLQYSSVGNMLLNNNNTRNTNLFFYHTLFSDCPNWRTDYDGSREARIFKKCWIWNWQFWRKQ